MLPQPSLFGGNGLLGIGQDTEKNKNDKKAGDFGSRRNIPVLSQTIALKTSAIGTIRQNLAIIATRYMHQ